MAVRQMVLLAGYDYHGGVDFEGIALNRFKRFLKKDAKANTDPDFKVTLMDVKSGEIRTSQYATATKKRTWTVSRSMTAVSSSNYTGHVFDKNQAGVMSITDFYEVLRTIGKNEPGTLLEASVFSHGWWGGPILVDSFDPNPGSAARDPNDKDARGNKDFNAPNMDATFRSDFGKAFATDGLIWIWGCVFTRSYFQVLHRTIKNAKYSTDPAKVKDTDVFKFEFDRALATQIYGDDTTFFPAIPVGGTPTLKFDRTWKDVKDFFRRGLPETYCGKIAAMSGHTCFGALLGTYSDYEKGVSLPIMIIPRKVPPYSDNFTRYIKFYTAHLGMTLDAEGQGYGAYLP